MKDMVRNLGKGMAMLGAIAVALVSGLLAVTGLVVGIIGSVAMMAAEGVMKLAKRLGGWAEPEPEIEHETETEIITEE